MNTEEKIAKKKTPLVKKGLSNFKTWAETQEKETEKLANGRSRSQIVYREREREMAIFVFSIYSETYI